MNKPIYLTLSILEISRTLMYEFWHDYMKPKYADNVKLCYMDTDSFIMHIKTEFVALRPRTYSYLAEDDDDDMMMMMMMMIVLKNSKRNKKMCNKTKTEI